MSLTETTSAALGIAAISCIGRSVLSWLPPGDTGSYRTAQLPVTWAVSYVLGCATIAVGASVAALAGLSVSCAWIAGLAALAALIRWATLPGALVPRHEMPREIPGAGACALFALAIAVAVFACATPKVDGGVGLWSVRVQAWLSQGWLVGFDGPATSRGALDAPPLQTGAIAFASWPMGRVSDIAARVHLLACFLAAILLIERAMAGVRRAPLGRRLLVVVFALALSPAVSAEDGDLAMAALCALALLGTVSWTRRADARGLALACIGWSALALVRPGGFVLAFAGLAAMLAATARPSLRRGALCAGGTALVILIWPAAAWLRHVPMLSDDPLSTWSSSWALIDRTRVAICIAPIWIVLGAAIGPALLQGLRPTQNASLDAGDPNRPRRDLAALLLFGAVVIVCTAIVVLAGAGPKMLLARTLAPGLLVQTAPFAALLAARALLRAERAT